MNKKNMLIISSLVFIILAFAAVTLSNKLENKTDGDIPHTDAINTLSNVQQDTAGSGLSAEAPAKGMEQDSSDNGDLAQDEPDAARSRQIEVNHNTAEYDLKTYLCENSIGEAYIKFEYYLEGIGMQKIVKKSQVPEIENIFDGSENDMVDEEYFKNICVYLNPKYLKAYFSIEERTDTKGMPACIYVFDLKKSSCKKLFSKTGGFTGLYFTKDYKLMGFSYYNKPEDGVFKEKSLLQIFDCEKDMFIVSESRLSNGVNIGGRDNPEHVYDYVFLSWNSNNIARIRESVRPANADSVNDENNKREVLYSVLQNVFMNLDSSTIKDDMKTDEQEDGEDLAKQGDAEGTVIQSNAEEGSAKQDDGKDPEKQGDAEINAKQGDMKDPAKQGDTEGNTGQTGNGSGAKEAEDTLSIKALKEFYTCLSLETEYPRALEMLSEDFELELNFLKQYGVKSLSKDDFKLEEATVYSSILKLIKLESIVWEELSGDTSTIYYYQLFSIEAGSQMRQPIAAKLIKSDGKWLISSAVEVDSESKPFK